MGLFHVAQLAVRATGDVRRRVVRARYGRRDVLNLRARVTGSAPCVRDVRGRLATLRLVRSTTTSASWSPWPARSPGGKTRSSRRS